MPLPSGGLTSQIPHWIVRMSIRWRYGQELCRGGVTFG